SARFRHARLEKANLERATLQQADFTGASLRQANLYRANCRHTNFTDADLTSAELAFADLRGADLSAAALTDAEVRNTHFDQHTVFPSGLELTDRWRWRGTGPDPRRAKPGTAVASTTGEGLSGFVRTLALKVDPARLEKALAMLKAERFQLYSQVAPDHLVG